MNDFSISIDVSVTDNITIVCNVKTANPAVATPLNLTRSSTANNVEFDGDTGTITITGVTADNAGTYTCTADNGVTKPTNISFVLTVNSQLTSTTAAPTTNTSIASELNFSFHKLLHV